MKMKMIKFILILFISLFCIVFFTSLTNSKNAEDINIELNNSDDLKDLNNLNNFNYQNIEIIDFDNNKDELLNNNDEINDNSGNGINKILSFFLKETKRINDFFFSLFNLEKIKKENNELKQENVNLKSSLEKYSEIEKENGILKNALNIEEKQNYNFILADVVSKSPLNFYQRFTIDKGKKDNISLNDVVVWNGNVLVGEIKEIKNDISFVRAINDNDFRVAVFVGENKIEAVLKGNGLKPPILEMLPSNTIINKKDKIFTSGLDEKFPKGLLIGEVKEIENYQDKIFQEAEVELSFHWDDLIQVLVLSKN